MLGNEATGTHHGIHGESSHLSELLWVPQPVTVSHACLGWSGHQTLTAHGCKRVEMTSGAVRYCVCTPSLVRLLCVESAALPHAWPLRTAAVLC